MNPIVSDNGGSSSQPITPSTPVTMTAASAQSLEDTINALSSQLNTVQLELNQQKAISASLAASNTPVPSQNRIKPPKCGYPDPFKGNSSQIHDFIDQCKMVFTIQDVNYPTETSKVNFAATFLRDSAQKWYRKARHTNSPPPWAADFELFHKELQLIFGDPDPRGTAALHLTNLKQTRSALEYANEFRQHATEVDSSQYDLNNLFYANLKSSVKDDVYDIDKNQPLESYIKQVILADKRVYTREKEKRKESGNNSSNNRNTAIRPASNISLPNRRPPSTPFPPTSSSNSVPVPMDLDTLQATPARPRRSFGKLTQGQRDYRRDNNLCLYCGLVGHQVSNCPSLNRNKPNTTPQQHSSVQSRPTTSFNTISALNTLVSIPLPQAPHKPTSTFNLHSCMRPSTTITPLLAFPAKITNSSGKSFTISVTIDCGANTSIMDQDAAGTLSLLTYEDPHPIRVILGNGQELKDSTSMITESALLAIGNHQEKISFRVRKIKAYTIFLGMDWLTLHDPSIRWQPRKLTFDSEFCQHSCLTTIQSLPGISLINTADIDHDQDKCFQFNLLTSTTSANTNGHATSENHNHCQLPPNVPKIYQAYAKVFSKDLSRILPPHRQYDHRIDLLPDTIPPSQKTVCAFSRRIGSTA